jgi:3-oxoacyl-ACP reductase-like protein
VFTCPSDDGCYPRCGGRVVQPCSGVDPDGERHACGVEARAAGTKFGKTFSEVSETATSKEPSASKLAVQNKIVSDLEKEFGSGPDDAAEIKLVELAVKFRDYALPGKGGLIAKMLASKMPGGFDLSAIKAYLSNERCLPSGRI